MNVRTLAFYRRSHQFGNSTIRANISGIYYVCTMSRRKERKRKRERAGCVFVFGSVYSGIPFRTKTVRPHRFVEIDDVKTESRHRRSFRNTQQTVTEMFETHSHKHTRKPLAWDSYRFSERMQLRLPKWRAQSRRQRKDETVLHVLRAVCSARLAKPVQDWVQTDKRITWKIVKSILFNSHRV